jgi:hypothetical protein
MNAPVQEVKCVEAVLVRETSDFKIITPHPACPAAYRKVELAEKIGGFSPGGA